MNFKLILLFLIIVFVFLSLKQNGHFKVVIQTHRNYKSHLDKLLNSIDYKNHLNDIILVYSDEKVYKVENKPQLPSIYSKLNLWEYTSFIEVDNNKHLDNFNSNYYFFVHDTCWCDNHQKFWKNLETMAKETDEFYYAIHGAVKNIGMCSNLFLTKFSDELKKYGNFSKSTGIQIERHKGIHKLTKYKKVNEPDMYKGEHIIDKKTRVLYYHPYVAIYKHNGKNSITEKNSFKL